MLDNNEIEIKSNLEDNLRKVFEKQKNLINENFELKNLVINLIKELKKNIANKNIIKTYEIQFKIIRDKFDDSNN